MLARRAEDAAHAPTAPVVKVARRNLRILLNRSNRALKESKFKRKSPLHQNAIRTGERTSEGATLAELEIPELQQQLQQDEAGARGATGLSPLAKSLSSTVRLYRRAPNLHHGSRKCKVRGLS